MHCDLTCTSCGLSHDARQLQNLCARCGKPLFAGYDLPGLKSTFTIAAVAARPEQSMWRFWEVLPVGEPGEAVTLGEGLTPLVRAAPRGPFAPFQRLFIKDESLNPTGSFKARGMSAAITRAKALGARAVALPSAGNAAGAAACYAARAGLMCHLFVPEDTPPANLAESVLAGAKVYLVNGLISDCGKLCRQACQRYGWFDLATLKEPFRVEGKKIMGYELLFDLAAAGRVKERHLPDCIVYPAGGGTGLVGMWKAFDEMQALGWIGPQRPRMVLVQAAGCAPLARAYEQGLHHAEPIVNASTVAAGLRVPAAIADFLMLRIVRESRGTALAVTDGDLLEGAGELARWQGIQACPEGGAAWKAVQRLAAAGWLKADEVIVSFNTGSALKYTHAVPVGELPRLDHRNPDCIARLEAVLS